jgi:hypothetical protein
MEHWTIIEWGAFIGALAVVFGAIGSAVTTFFHGWRARERMFARLESLEGKFRKDHRRLGQLYGIAIGTGVIKESVVAIEDEEETP